MEYKNLLVSTLDRVQTITVNRPDKLNALNHQTLVELEQAFTAARDDAAVALVIVTGAGEKSFVAGADIEELSKHSAISGQQFALYGQKVYSLIQQMTKPVIACVNGYALGGGCELALACHIRVASENAKFGQPEVLLGVIPGYGGTQRLARLVGLGRATEMILTGNQIPADEAFRIGLVNKVFPKGEALQGAMEMAKTILTRSQVAVRFAMDALHAVDEMGLEEGLKTEAALFGLCCGSEDYKEGTKAFLEKRPAVFPGK